MRKLTLVTGLIAVTSLLNACTDGAYDLHMYKQKLESQNLTTWGMGPENKIVYQLPTITQWNKKDGGYTVLYIPATENMSNSTEEFSTHYAPANQNQQGSVEEFIDFARDIAINKCNQASFKVLSQTSNTVFYQIKTGDSVGKSCIFEARQTSYTKAFIPNNGSYSIQYIAMTDKVSPEKIDAGKNTIAKSYLVKNNS